MSRQEPIVAVFGASNTRPGDPDYEAGVRCGRLLAEAGYAVATGGYAGLMEAVSSGAASAGGHVIGVTAPAVFPGRDRANAHVVEERPAATLTERIHDIIDIASATITLPGSIGTITELLVAWNKAYVAQFSGRTPQPVVAVGETWRHVVTDLSKRLATDGSFVTCVDSVDQAVAELVRRLG